MSSSRWKIRIKHQSFVLSFFHLRCNAKGCSACPVETIRYLVFFSLFENQISFTLLTTISGLLHISYSAWSWYAPQVSLAWCEICEMESSEAQAQIRTSSPGWVVNQKKLLVRYKLTLPCSLSNKERKNHKLVTTVYQSRGFRERKLLFAIWNFWNPFRL